MAQIIAWLYDRYLENTQVVDNGIAFSASPGAAAHIRQHVPALADAQFSWPRVDSGVVKKGGSSIFIHKGKFCMLINEYTNGPDDADATFRLIYLTRADVKIILDTLYTAGDPIQSSREHFEFALARYKPLDPNLPYD